MTGQNKSSAVMQQRGSEAQRAERGRNVAPHCLDYFPTPPFATRALCEFLGAELGDLSALSAWEPACGEGHMARVLAESFGRVRVTDVHYYPPAEELLDFAFFGADEPPVDFVITNPPFLLAEAFIAAAAKVARAGFAMLVRSAFLEGQARHASLWSKNPPSYVLQFTERVVMLEGRLIQAGKVDPFAEKLGTKASTATAYVWLVWLEGEDDTRLRWLPPCRERLERPGDYPDYAAEFLPPTEEGLFA